MKIAISTIGINDRAGTGRHAVELIRHLAGIDDKNHYFIFLSPGQMERLRDIDGKKNFNWFVIPTQFQNFLTGTVWNVVVLAKKLRAHRIDLVHFLEINRCILPRYCPILITVHGLIALRVKSKDGYLRGFYHKHIIPMSLRRADHLIAVSENTKSDIVQLLHIPESRISVVPNGCTDWASMNDLGSTAEKINESLKLVPYILFVSRLEHPNKNHVNLLRAFKALLRETGQSLKLVLVGERGWRFETIDKSISDLGIREDVMLTGFVSDTELRGLYSRAKAFVMPSLYEGFGIPVIEAMSLGIPVACSNTSSLREIAGDAALFFDPTNVDEIMQSLKTVLWDDNVRISLIVKGQKRAEGYSWPSIAMKTVRLYSEIVSQMSVQ